VLPYVSAAVAAELADPEDPLLSMTRPLETLADLRDADNFTVRAFGETVAGISEKALLKHRAALRETDLTPGACPPDKNHKLAANPYASKWPTDWEARMAAKLRITGHVCVTELVEHMVAASAKVFENTTHADDW
jgi:hypothetical protein